MATGTETQTEKSTHKRNLKPLWIALAFIALITIVLVAICIGSRFY